MLTENFDQLYEKHFAGIYRHCYGIVRNKEDAEELTHEAFVKAYFHRNQFDAQKGKIRNWIFTIATNLCFDFMGSAAWRKQQQAQSLDEQTAFENNSPLPHQQSEHHQLQRFIEDCLAELLAEERTAVTLRHVQDFTLHEIAEILGMSSPNSAKNRIKSGEKQLKKCLEKKGIDDNYRLNA